MKLKVLIAAIIAVAIAGGIWSEVDGINSTNQDSAPTVEQPSIKPTADPTEQTAEPTVEPSSEPSNKPSEETKPTSPISPPKEIVEAPVSQSAFLTMLTSNLPSRTIKENDDGLAVITNTSSLYVLVNKKRNLPSTYAPKDLVIPDVPFSFSGDSPKKQMRKEAAKALESLFDAAKVDGIKLKAVSGYRSYATQKSIFNNNVKNKGEKEANRTSARPGQSEHQTGLAMDISSASVNYALETSFGETIEGKWLAKHTPEHGFIIRYLKGKESITGYSYEPWHVRYVGKEAAKDITKKKVTFEQYFDAISASIV
jgi:D-alanyl-D-alanine carboxypeptidase